MKNNTLKFILLFIIFILLSSCTITKNSQKIENDDLINNNTTNSTLETINNNTAIDDNNLNNNIILENMNINYDSDFGGVFIDMTIEDFNNKGFEYGDSINIKFSNDFVLNDIPYYYGYYAKPGDYMLIGYPSYKYIKACICNSDSLWKVADLNDNIKATIELNEKNKYKSIQDNLNIVYYDEREKYASDEVFANFRNVKVGNIKNNILFRGASPADNQHNRAKYVDNLIKANNIKYDIDLSDSKEKIEQHINKNDFQSDFFLSLYNNNKVSNLVLNMNYRSKEFANKIVQSMIDMSKNEGPYYIHCVEGKDRTGFLLMIIEGLAGATYDEIINDYMITYDNYYNINKNNNKEKYDLIKSMYIDDMLRSIAGEENENTPLEDLDWTNIVGRYLSDNGMQLKDIDNWYKNLTE